MSNRRSFRFATAAKARRIAKTSYLVPVLSAGGFECGYGFRRCGLGFTLLRTMRTADWIRRLLFVTAVAALLALSCSPRATAQGKSGSLLIYAIDVEGGQATLLVSPSKASLLVNTGWPGSSGRDADRIAAAMKDAGITKIDHVLITHFHVD